MKLGLKGNAAAAAGEQLVIGATFFIFYGVLIRSVGADLVGVLSLVLILSSLVSMTSTGFASALAHFVPLFEGRGDRDQTVGCIETTLLATVLLYGVVLALGYVPFSTLVIGQAGSEHAALVRNLMIPAVVQVFFLGVSTATTLALTALHRSDLRLWSSSAGALLSLVIVAVAVPRYGAVGALWALASQSALLTLVGWIQLCRLLPTLPRVPWHLDRAMLRQLFKLGLNLQAQSLLVSGVEPVTRLLLGQFGSLSAVAYFSLAYRYVIQLRALVFAGAQPLLAAFSQARDDRAETIGMLYRNAEEVMALTAILTFAAAAGAAGFIGEIWIGERQPQFVLFSIILSLGWFANTLTLAAYFNAYSLGQMAGSLIAHALLFVLNFTAGAALGWAFGAVGVVAGMGIALLISAIVLKALNGRLAPSTFPTRVGWRVAILACASATGAAGALSSYAWLREALPPLLAGLCCGLVWLIIVSPGLYIQSAARVMLSAMRARI